MPLGKKQIEEIVLEYEDWFKKEKYKKQKFTKNSVVDSYCAILEHCHYMIIEAKIFLTEDKLEEAKGCLEFVNGCYWALGISRLISLRDYDDYDE